jgi:HSP20 family molecular chaperone IbpA
MLRPAERLDRNRNLWQDYRQHLEPVHWGINAAADWRSDPRWHRLPDSDRVYHNPNIPNTVWRPRADIFRDSREYLRVEFELPGVTAEDIDLSVTDNSITIAALKPQTKEEEAGSYFLRERHFGRFVRVLRLPERVDPNNVHAGIDRGVLKIVLPTVGQRISIGSNQQQQEAGQIYPEEPARTFEK